MQINASMISTTLINSLCRNVLETEEQGDIAEYWARLKRVCTELDTYLGRRYSRVFRREVERGIERMEMHVEHMLTNPNLTPRTISDRVEIMTNFIALDMLATYNDTNFWISQIGYCDPQIPDDPPYM